MSQFSKTQTHNIQSVNISKTLRVHLRMCTYNAKYQHFIRLTNKHKKEKDSTPTNITECILFTRALNSLSTQHTNNITQYCILQDNLAIYCIALNTQILLQYTFP